MLYVSFCYAFPQSQEKFQSAFREKILQTCSQWICGISVRPNLHEKWLLGKLEPPGFRITNQRHGDSDDDDNEHGGGRSRRVRDKLERMGMGSERKRSQTSVMLAKRYTNTTGRRKTAAPPPQKFGASMGTNILKGLFVISV